MTAGDAHPDHRSRPRRRGPALVEAILTAALDELRDRGYAGLTMEAVARRAGASKASLYRRWTTRSALVMDAVYRLAPRPDDLPDTGGLRGDLLAALRRSAATLQGPAGDEAARLHALLRAYTAVPARQDGAESWKGMLKPGFAADLCVLREDPFARPIAALPEDSVDLTVCAGRVVFDAEDAAKEGSTAPAASV